MRDRILLGFYLLGLVIILSSHSFYLLSFFAIVLLCLARSSWLKILKKALKSIFFFNIAISIGYIAIAVLQERVWLEYILLFNLRVFVLTLTTLLFSHYVNIALALSFSKTLSFLLSVSLSQIYAKAVPDSKTAVQATKASIENLNLLQAGRGEAGISLGDSFSDAYKGDPEAGFKAPLDKLRTIAALYPNYIHFVAAADSGIKSFADIKGKRISVGAPKEKPSRTAFSTASSTAGWPCPKIIGPQEPM